MRVVGTFVPTISLPNVLRLSLIAILLSCLSLPVHAESHKKDIAQIKSAVRKMDEASSRKDIQGYMAFTHPNFTNVDKHGDTNTHSKEERREKMAQLFSRATKITGRTTVKQITFTKEGAVVNKSSTNSIVITGIVSNTELKGTGTYRDLWVKTPRGWLQKTSRTITDSSTINGQNIP